METREWPKLTHEVLGTWMIKVTVGRSRQEFVFHRKPACKLSTFFANLCKGHHGDIVAPHQLIEHNIFEYVVDYIYRGTIPSGPKRKDPAYGELMRKIYYLAEGFGMNDLANKTMDTYQNYQRNNHARLNYMDILEVYNSTTNPDSKLRWYSAVTAAVYVMRDWETRKRDDIPRLDRYLYVSKTHPEFLVDMTRAQSEHRTNILIHRADHRQCVETDGFGYCEFHIHSPGETCHSTGITTPADEFEEEDMEDDSEEDGEEENSALETQEAHDQASESQADELSAQDGLEQRVTGVSIYNDAGEDYNQALNFELVLGLRDARAREYKQDMPLFAVSPLNGTSIRQSRNVPRYISTNYQTMSPPRGPASAEQQRDGSGRPCVKRTRSNSDLGGNSQCPQRTLFDPAYLETTNGRKRHQSQSHSEPRHKNEPEEAEPLQFPEQQLRPARVDVAPALHAPVEEEADEMRFRHANQVAPFAWVPAPGRRPTNRAERMARRAYNDAHNLCRCCNSPHHAIEECPKRTKPVFGQRSRFDICMVCSSRTHESRHCPSRTTQAFKSEECMVCNLNLHESHDCPNSTMYRSDLYDA